MEKQNAIALSLDEIIFENRNRLYGAFQLRRMYNDNLRRGLFIGSSVFVGVFLLLWNTFANTPETEARIPFDDPTIVSNIPDSPPMPPIPEPQPPKLSINVPTQRFTELVAVAAENANSNDEITRVEDLDKREISTVTETGNDSSTDLLIDPNATTGTGNSLIESEPAEETIFLTAEQMPEFQGDLAKFLSKHLRFPASSRNKGISGVVYVSFVINSTGAVTDIKVLKGIDQDCDAEAARVIAKMPDWRPGRQNGRNVSVRYSLPIRFSVQE